MSAVPMIETNGRSLPEWRGKTPDAKIPPRVKVRVFERHNGICHLSGRRIRAGEAWDCDHVIALCNGGLHRESNLAPALTEPHKIKTKADRRIKKKTDRMRKKHLGIRVRSKFPCGKNSPFKKKIGTGEVVARDGR